MLEVREHERLAPLSTFRTGGTARYFTEARARGELPEAFEKARELGVRAHVLGGGSNTIFRDGELDLLVCKMEIPGFKIIHENAETALARVAAGENWDAVVERTVSLGLSGIEALSAIPGTAGAAPVQNIGAYGQEVGSAIEEIEAYDREASRFVALRREDCGFGYRKSIFNSSAKGRFAVVSTLLKLSKRTPSVPDYPSVRAYFAKRKNGRPTLQEIRDAIRAIRASKLPDPSVIPNAGSFFKNPIVSTERAAELAALHPGMPSFPAEGGAKIPAGWLIEQAGLKRASFGPVGTYENNALVLVNRGGATTDDVFAARDEIKKMVLEKFGIELEQEPEVVG